MAPRISVVIPMHNAAKYIGATVDSVFAQTFADWELILCDDGSTDSTVAVANECASRDARIRVVKGENEGAGGARNRGAAVINKNSEFIVFLDSDDIWEPDALSLLVTALEEHPEAPAAHGRPRAIDPQGQPFPDDVLGEFLANRQEIRDGKLAPVPRGAPTTFEALLVENYPVTPGTTLVRHRVWDAVGDYARETQPCEDWDYNLRLARLGPIVLVDQVILNWRRHPGATSLNSRRWRNAYLRVRRRTITSHENTPAQRAAAIAAFRLNCTNAWRDVGRQLGRRNLRRSLIAAARGLVFESAYRRARRASA